ncbi:MAG TPA: CotH kinase family protein, partial [Polyangiaceae bacterium]
SFMMVPTGFKRSLNLSLDPFHRGQKLLGYRNLNWLNAAHDPTYMRTILATTIMQDYVPAPSANHVRVVINGESWGIYVNVQPFDNAFVAERFGEASGRRWKVPGSPDAHGNLAYLGEDPQAYQGIYELKSKADAGAYRDLIRLCRTLSQTSSPELEHELSGILDIDEALRYLALDNLLINSDSYLARSSDYGLYQGKDGKFALIPHDVDETFNVFETGPGESRVGIELDPLAGADNPERPLIAKLLSVPVWRRRYLSLLLNMAEKWLNWERLSPIVSAHERMIREELQRDTRKLTTFGEFSAGLDAGFVREGHCGKERVLGLKSFVEQRRAYLLEHPAFGELTRAKR